MIERPLVVSVVGPTAVGKTSLAIALAKRYDTEIISADSRQFYREMEIGTAKPSQEELGQAIHHFINSHSISSLYSAGDFGRDAKKKIEEIHSRKELIIVVGGSSLHLKAIWEGFDDIPKTDPQIREDLNRELREKGLTVLLEELASLDPVYYGQVDRSNGQRVIRALEVTRGTGLPFSSFRKNEEVRLDYINLKIGLELDRELLYSRINERMDDMIKNGLFDEARSLLKYKNHNALQTVGYAEVFDYLEGIYDEAEAIRLLKRNSRRYAKRQMTWFRRYDDIHWFEPNNLPEIVKLIDATLSGK